MEGKKRIQKRKRQCLTAKQKYELGLELHSNAGRKFKNWQEAADYFGARLGTKLDVHHVTFHAKALGVDIGIESPRAAGGEDTVLVLAKSLLFVMRELGLQKQAEAAELERLVNSLDKPATA